MSSATIKIVENEEEGTISCEVEFEPSLNLKKENREDVPFTHFLAMKAMQAINEASK